jgi:plastocyanin
MNRFAFVSLSAAVALPSFALAAEVTGTISDPALRRKVQYVYVEKVDGKFTPPAEPLVVNQKGNVYLPHTLGMVAGTKVKFISEDPELHNVFARNGKKVSFNEAQPPGRTFDRAMNEPGFVHLSCNIHKEMSAWLLVFQNPFFTQPDPKTGEFTINGLPEGQHTIRIWGEKLSDEQKNLKFPATAGAPLKVASK